jgi:hypothetical protein
VADHVAIIDRGCIIQNDDLASMKASFHRIVLHFNTPVQDPPLIDGCFNWQGCERQWSTYFRGAPQELEEQIRRRGGEVIDRHSPTLAEIFLAQVDSRHSAMRGQP